jgi:PAS domain S-box-containing protein
LGKGTAIQANIYLMLFTYVVGNMHVLDKDITSVLLIAENSFEAQGIQQTLHKYCVSSYKVEWYTQLADGLGYLKSKAVDLVLLSIQVSKHDDIRAFDLVLQAAPDALVLVINTANDKTPTQVFLTNQTSSKWRPRVLQYVNTRKTTVLGLRHAEEALFDEKERGQVTLNSIGDAVLATDPDSNITYLNVIAEQMTGWTNKEAVGRALEEVLQIVDVQTGNQPIPKIIGIARRRRKSAANKRAVSRMKGIYFCKQVLIIISTFEHKQILPSKVTLIS